LVFISFISYKWNYIDIMNIEALRVYCLKKKGVEETFPFDEVTLVFKVMGKMFLLTGLDAPEFRINVKTRLR